MTSGAAIRALSARELAARVREGALSALEIADAFLERSAAVEGGVHAFLHLEADAIRRAAARVDARRSGGFALGPLAGVPVALKDNIVVRGVPTTCASRILEGWVPTRDATAVARLRAADAVLFGKTNLDEFAMGSSTENSAFGPTRNPWDPGRVPGGSSGGSAAAVASGQVPLALGSDTGGSVRQPASFCGLVGVKPHYGRVSRSGLVAFASSLDGIGPLARTADDAELLLGVIAGPDPFDATSLREDAAPGRGPGAGASSGPEEGSEPLRGVTIGVPRDWLAGGLDPEVGRVLDETQDLLARLGATVREVALPIAEHAVAAYYVLADAEASSNLSRFDGVRFGRRAGRAGTIDELFERTRGEGFGPEVKRRILLGAFVLSAGYYEAYYARAQRVRARMKRDVDAALVACDALLLPTAPTPAFRLGEKRDDPLAMYLSDVFTLPANLVQNPAVSFPAGRAADGLPIGIQLYGRHAAEATLFRIVRAHERAWTTPTGAVGRGRGTPYDAPLGEVPGTERERT